jgi:uncharacterized protein YecE (DUF72 family)
MNLAKPLPDARGRRAAVLEVQTIDRNRMSQRRPTGAEVRIGTSGFQYDHWRGPFYPNDLPRRRWFEHYAERFNTVEINNTFYNLPKAETFDRWREQAPDGFLYVLKYSRYGTHIKRLKDPARHVDVFMERAARLEDHLGPILVQLPPNWHADVQRLAAFLDAVPREQRWAIELRDPDWLREEVYAVLGDHGAALCLHDMIDDHPRVVTAGFVYLRFHGDHYRGSYSPQALSGVARRIRGHLQDGRDVFAFFNNDEQAYAVENALDLRRYLNDD